MRIALRVPKGANCLSFHFRFLSEEFPEFVDDIYNDAFIAELDRSTWTARHHGGPGDRRARQLRRRLGRQPDPRQQRRRLQRRWPRRASGTTYDGATRLLRASTRVTPGQHKLYLSIFDQGDRIYDSAVFLDNLLVGRRSKCRTGAIVNPCRRPACRRGAPEPAPRRRRTLEGAGRGGSMTP